MPIEVQSTKMVFMDESDPSDRLVVQYNPSVIESVQSVEWKSVRPAGEKDKPQYSHTRSRKWSFTLYLNDMGRGFPTQRTVEQTIEWLERRQQPSEAGSQAQWLRPPTVIWIWRRAHRVVIEDIRVKRLVFRPIPQALSAYLLQADNLPSDFFRNYPGAGSYNAFEAFGGTGLVAQGALNDAEQKVLGALFETGYHVGFGDAVTQDLAKQSSLRPLDAVRAEVDITLYELHGTGTGASDEEASLNLNDPG